MDSVYKVIHKIHICWTLSNLLILFIMRLNFR